MVRNPSRTTKKKKTVSKSKKKINLAKKRQKWPIGKNPKVSIISPFRDNVPQVQECVDSLKAQNYKNIEIILVSDLIKWKDKDKRIKSVMNPNFKGAGEKRNAGAKKAKGDIIFFLDSDCTVKKDAISTLVKLFQKIDTDAISGKTLAPEKGNVLCIATGLEYEDRFDRMGENFVNVSATTCLGMKRKAYESMGGFRDYSTGEATGEDWDFSKRFTNAGYKIYHTNKVMVHHNHRNDSLKKWYKRRIHHSRYRITHKRRYGQTFEEYFSLPMFIDTTVLFAIPVTFRMFKKSKRWQVLFLPAFAAIRNIAWLIGMAKGIIFDKPDTVIKGYIK